MRGKTWIGELGAYVLIVVVAAFGFHAHQVEIHRAEKANVVLCALRADIDQKIAGARQYLKTHPHGAPSLGITADQIRADIAARQSTRQAMAILYCPPRP